MPKAGVNNTSLKQQNRGLVLRLIATGECSSRIELAQKTGLSKMTVTYIVNEFLEQGDSGGTGKGADRGQGTQSGAALHRVWRAEAHWRPCLPGEMQRGAL